MTDIGKFPGTEMEVFLKYPDSYRLDQPDFSDVSKTTFAKGIISDFKKVQDDPIKVQSLVKVQVEGLGESDAYLPLFYHPKVQYWDDNNHKATDFNQEGGYFDRAWMSFRCGDEVAVMLKENKPVAVMGFAARPPIAGENILKFILENPQVWLDCLKQSAYADKDNGPDGKPLKLEKQCELIYKKQATEKRPTADSTQQFYISTLISNIQFNPGPSAYLPGYVEGDGTFFGGWSCGQEYLPIWQTSTTVSKVLLKTYAIQQFLAVIGPILYCIQFYSQEMDTIDENTDSQTYFSGNSALRVKCPGHNGYPDPAWVAAFDTYDTAVPEQGYTESSIMILNDYIAVKEATNATQPSRNNLSYWTNNRRYKVLAMVIQAGVYTEKLYNDIKSGAKAPHNPIHTGSVVSGVYPAVIYGDCDETNFYQKYDEMTLQSSMRYVPGSSEFLLTDAANDARGIRMTKAKLYERDHNPPA